MYLLDTNLVSELRKIRLGRADKNVALWATSVDANDLYLSVISVQEITIGLLLIERRDPAQGAIFRTWLDDYVLPTFAERLLDVDLQVAQLSATLHVPDPRPTRPMRDGLIAATALVHRMTVVTRNVSDFLPMGVHVLNPWEPR
jgi:predicted nucleic acid-binding protein